MAAKNTCHGSEKRMLWQQKRTTAQTRFILTSSPPKTCHAYLILIIPTLSCHWRNLMRPRGSVRTSARCSSVPMNSTAIFCSYALTDVVVAEVDVLAVVMEHRVFAEGNGGLVVHPKSWCSDPLAGDVGGQMSLPNAPAGGHRCCDVLSFFEKTQKVFSVMYSALHEERATTFCFCDFRLMGLSPRKNRAAAMLLRTSTSPAMLPLLEPQRRASPERLGGEWQPRSRAPATYLRMCLTAARCSTVGASMKLLT